MPVSLPVEETPVPTVEDLELDQFTVSGKPFEALLDERQHYKQLIEDAEKAIKDLDVEIGAALDLKGVKSVIWSKDTTQKYLVLRREASMPRHILDRTLLLSAGVTPLQLEAGSKLGKPGASGITVRRVGEKKDSE